MPSDPDARCWSTTQVCQAVRTSLLNVRHGLRSRLLLSEAEYVSFWIDQVAQVLSQMAPLEEEPPLC